MTVRHLVPAVLTLLMSGAGLAQDGGSAMTIDNDACAGCHAPADGQPATSDVVSLSKHSFLGCLDCHQDRAVIDPAKDPVHQRPDPSFLPGDTACRQCHSDEGGQYVVHGRFDRAQAPESPTCASCHGAHDIAGVAEPASRVNREKLPGTCAACHENLNLTSKYELRFNHPVELFQASVHGQADGGAATCSDCHFQGGSAHKIWAAGNPDSPINHFRIPETCGQCHFDVVEQYNEGIHGKLLARGSANAPVCTTCHGEHGIISPSDPRSPVSPTHVAQQTCTPCHESARLNARLGITTGSLPSFIDSYHGLKSQSGDTTVANCASCHGVHKILPSSDRASTINPANLRATCGECHPGITAEIAQTSIHGVGGATRSRATDVVENFYILAIVGIIGLMVLHWLLDLGTHIRALLAYKPQIRRMTPGEVWQHTVLMISFVVLVISGFSLRSANGILARLFFGWEGGFEFRGTLHRIAAVVFLGSVVWHMVYIAVSGRGRKFVRDMFPEMRDWTQFWQRIRYNLGHAVAPPSFGRFSYVEKAEYWALVWGTIVMALTGFLLWFDNWFIAFLPRWFLEVALVVHYWEAWLATLAILVWHLYSTVFSPHVYPMNPSWLTGKMPEKMYRHEHPDHLEEARRESEGAIVATTAGTPAPEEKQDKGAGPE